MNTVNRYLIFPLAKALLSFVFVIIAYRLFVGQDVGELVFVSSIGLLYATLFYMVPITILYYTYKRSSKDKKLLVRGDGRWSISVNSKVYHENEVESIDWYLTKAKAKASLDLSLWGHYHYYVFNLIDGGRIVLSCLVTDQFKKIKSTDFNIKKQFFPIPKKDRI